MPQIFNSLEAETQHQRHQMHEICRVFSRSPSKGNLKKLKTYFNHCGGSVFIEHGFHCDYGNKISLGERVYLNINCTLLDGGLINIGDDCLIGPNVQILTINHATSPKERLIKANYADDVTIGCNVWIGAGAIILPGVTIGDAAVIGAGSLVNKNVEASSLYAGNPAKKIRVLEE